MFKERIWTALLIGICAALVIVLANCFLVLASLSIWWSDSIWGLQAMLEPIGAAQDAQDALLHKLAREGRWLNYMVANVFAAVPGWVFLVGSLLAFAVFLRHAAMALGAPPGVAMAVALTGLALPPIWAQWLWPATAFPAFLLLALAVPFVGRLHPWLFFGLFGVAYLGTVSWPYYLLILLWVPWIGAVRGRVLMRAATALSAWVAGFLLGFAAIHAANWVVLGRAGIDIAAWRDASPVTDLALLFDNVASRSGVLADFSLAFVGTGAVAVLLVGVIGWRLLRDRPDRRLAVGITASAAALSHFAATVPLGIGISPYSAGFFYVPLLLALFAWAPVTWADRGLWLVGLLSFAGVQVTALVADVEAYAANRTAVAQAVRDAAPRPPESFEGVIVVSADAPGLGTPPRTAGTPGDMMAVPDWSPSWVLPARAAGFRAVRLCDAEPSGCSDVLAKVDLDACLQVGSTSTARGAGAYCVHGVTETGWLVVSLR